MKEIMERLREPFDPSEIEWRVGATSQNKEKGMALAYVTNRAIQNRLDDVFGCFGWKNEYREWRGNSQLCGISVLHSGEWITKWDGADDSQTEATKGGLSDAMKRAAYQWGIGRYLYNLPATWVPIKPVGKSFVIAQEPTLPAWALPKGYKAETPAAQPQTARQPDQLVTQKHLLTLSELCTDPKTHKQDAEKSKKLKEIYGAMGYKRAPEIKLKDFEEIRRKRIESTIEPADDTELPFPMEDEK